MENRFLKALLATAGAAGAVLLFQGIKNSRQLELSDLEIQLPGLPTPFDNFKLLFITDTHLRQNTGKIDLILQKCDEIQPDLVCLGGDYCFNSRSSDSAIRLFTSLSARCKTIGILGNADYRTSENIRKTWAKHVNMLINQSLCLQLNGKELWITGVDDPHHKRDILPIALAPVPDNAFVILLAHSPEIISRPIDKRVKLILTGHTHGGQICLPGGKALYTNISLPTKFSSGLHQVGNAILYVSRGVGSTRLPVRFSCPPELTLIRLRA